MAVLVVIESSDLMFAVDSIPAIFAVTRDPFLVYTSNVFAILGLRAMFFLLAGVMDKFAYLKTGLAVILAYVGFKMLAIEFYHVPPGVSLLVIAAILAIAIAWSLLRPPPSHQSSH
jgi:tellurite resistance protein TerC